MTELSVADMCVTLKSHPSIGTEVQGVVSSVTFFFIKVLRMLGLLDHGRLWRFLSWESVPLVHSTVQELVLNLCLKTDEFTLNFFVHMDGRSHVPVSRVAYVIAIVGPDLGDCAFVRRLLDKSSIEIILIQCLHGLSVRDLVVSAHLVLTVKQNGVHCVVF